MIDIVLAILLVNFAWALGQRALSLFKVKLDSQLVTSIFSVSLGFFILAYFTLGLGLLGWLYPKLFWILFLVLAILLIPEFKIIFSTIHLVFSRLLQNRPKGLNLVLVSLLGFHILLNLIIALAPPTYWDTLQYHLAVPKLYLEQHQITFLPEIFESNYPLTIHMLFMLGMLLRSGILANLLNLALGVLSICAFYSLGRKYFSQQVGLWAAVFFYTTPVVCILTTQASADLGLTLYTSLAVYVLLDWWLNLKPSSLYLAAVFCGIACGVKYIGLVIFPMFIIAIVIRLLLLKPVKPLSVIKKTLQFLLIVFVICLPWFLKNYIFTGSPIFPLLQQHFVKFKTGMFVDGKSILFKFGPGERRDVWRYLLFSWHFRIQPEKFGGWSQSFGPLYLILVPLILLCRNVDKKIKGILFFCVAYFTLSFLWFLQIGRFYLPCFALLSVVGAYVWLEISRHDQFLRRICLGFILLALAFNTAILMGRVALRARVVLGSRSQEEYLSRRINSYPVIQFINRNLPGDAKIFSLEPRIYYLNRSVLRAGPISNTQLDYALTSQDEFLLYLKQQGVSHILVNQAYVRFNVSARRNPYYRPLLELINELSNTDLKMIYSENDTQLYKVNYGVN